MASTSTKRLDIDPAHQEIDIYAEDDDQSILTMDIWKSKYRYGDEDHPHASFRRVVEGVYAKDSDAEAKRDALVAMERGLWIPAGRIQAGAGTPNIVTLLNCYMCQDIHDSMTGIADALKDAMLTMQQGGGIGMNFSTLRPTGAFLRRTGAVASGPLPFMDMWNSMCATIMSAGSRRGAMMAVMSDEHPDLVRFITAKQETGRLTNFNVSVLVSDAFMDAVKEDEDWFLGFNVPKADGKHIFVTERETKDGVEPWYAYERHNARDLWDLILRNTYEWSEPGVIFIDRVNRRNNLSYCETITGTNPCGEQPLPPNGCCNLGAVNLAKMVRNPFQENAWFDFDLLGDVAAIGTRFLDNVIDTTLYPLEAQAKEEYAKRRIGVGITGLANAMAQMGIRYGSPESVEWTDELMSRLANSVYLASSHLAAERGSFPLYDKERWARNRGCVFHRLDKDVQDDIRANGIRNGVLLTIAPTGTTSLYAGNVSSGLEPVFMHQMQRNVRQDDDSYRPYTAYDYGYLLYTSVNRIIPDRVKELPAYMVDHTGLGVAEHLEIQAACQKWIDASVSKTINCPTEMDYESFKDMYEVAYATGCKGCTTYRYSEVRGSILSSVDDAKGQPDMPLSRPDVLAGHTYKVKWPSVNENYYITINDVAGQPFELFIQSTSSKYTDWTTALGLMISAIMRKGGDVSFIPEELAKVRSADDTAWVDGKFYGSLVALIGDTIGKHIYDGESSAVEEDGSTGVVEFTVHKEMGETCPQCNQPTLLMQEGCKTCSSCGYSNCY